MEAPPAEPELMERTVRRLQVVTVDTKVELSEELHTAVNRLLFHRSLQLLLCGAPPDRRSDKSGLTPLGSVCHALTKHRPGKDKARGTADADPANTALRIARLLLRFGARADVVDEASGDAPLHAAASAVGRGSVKRGITLMLTLLRAGADPHRTNAVGKTALMCCSTQEAYGSLEIAAEARNSDSWEWAIALVVLQFALVQVSVRFLGLRLGFTAAVLLMALGYRRVVATWTAFHGRYLHAILGVSVSLLGGWSFVVLWPHMPFHERRRHAALYASSVVLFMVLSCSDAGKLDKGTQQSLLDALAVEGHRNRSDGVQHITAPAPGSASAAAAKSTRASRAAQRVGLTDREVALAAATIERKRGGRVCETCLAVRPLSAHRCAPRTHHCAVCDVCVDEFDHHCHWIGRCVGAGNRRRFIVMLAVLGFCGLNELRLYVLHIVKECLPTPLADQTRHGRRMSPEVAAVVGECAVQQHSVLTAVFLLSIVPTTWILALLACQLHSIGSAALTTDSDIKRRRPTPSAARWLFGGPRYLLAVLLFLVRGRVAAAPPQRTVTTPPQPCRKSKAA